MMLLLKSLNQNTVAVVLTRRHSILKLPEKNYYISPIYSEESDVDDSDADPNYEQSSSPESDSEAKKERDVVQAIDLIDESLVDEEKKKGRKEKQDLIHGMSKKLNI